MYTTVLYWPIDSLTSWNHAAALSHFWTFILLNVMFFNDFFTDYQHDQLVVAENKRGERC